MNDKTEIKIFILFLLDELKYPLDDVTISAVIRENDYVGMFDFAECFSELCELGHIKEEKTQAGKRYVISESGHMVAAELQDTIMESIRRKSRRSALRLLSLHKRNAVPSATFYATDNGRYLFTASIAEREETVFHISMEVSSLGEAERMRQKFQESPEEVCRGIMAVLTGEVDYLLQ